jgi:hypothetical protein
MVRASQSNKHKIPETNNAAGFWKPFSPNLLRANAKHVSVGFLSFSTTTPVAIFHAANRNY